MIISHKHKFIFVKNPKTGSSAINFAFRNSGIDLDYIRNYEDNHGEYKAVPPIGPYWEMGFTIPHMLLMKFITQAQLETYDLYSVYRDPVEVFTSWYSYRHRNTKFTQEQLANIKITEENQVELFPIPIELYLQDYRPKPQTDYVGYERIQLVDYNNLSKEIEAIINRYNGTFTLMPKMNSYRLMDDVLSDEMVVKVKDAYKEDYILKNRVVSFVQ